MYRKNMNVSNLLKVTCTLFAVSYVLYLVSYFLRFYLAGEEYHVLMQYDSAGYALPVGLMWPTFVMSTLIVVAPLFNLAKGSFSAYKVFVFGTAVTLVLTLFSGVRVSVPIENFFGQVLGFLWGGVLFLGLLEVNKFEDSVDSPNLDNRFS